jgi:hypothetical protein
MNKHLEEVNESYFVHLFHAWKFAFNMIGGGVACFVHGLMPSCFTTTASETVEKLNSTMQERRKKS